MKLASYCAIHKRIISSYMYLIYIVKAYITGQTIITNVVMSKMTSRQVFHLAMSYICTYVYCRVWLHSRIIVMMTRTHRSNHCDEARTTVLTNAM